MGQYLAVVLLLVLGVLFASGSFITNKILVKGRPNAAKVAPYECGIVPTSEPPERFGVGFYLVAMLFIMFDIEIVFLYPYVVSRAELGAYGFWEVIALQRRVLRLVRLRGRQGRPRLGPRAGLGAAPHRGGVVGAHHHQHHPARRHGRARRARSGGMTRDRLVRWA